MYLPPPLQLHLLRVHWKDVLAQCQKAAWDGEYYRYLRGKLGLVWFNKLDNAKDPQASVL